MSGALAITLLRKLGILLLTMLAVSLLVFLVLEINVEDVAVKVLGQFSAPDQRHAWLLKNGYFDPLPVRYGRWLWGFVTGRWGTSLYYHADILALIRPRLLATGVLAACALGVTVPLALALGIAAGMKEGSGVDRSVSVLAIVTTSLPEFATAVFLSAVFVFTLGWLPGVSTLSSGFRANELVLPTAVLTLTACGYIARMTRASMAETMRAPFIRTALLKGLTLPTVLRRHVLRNALLPTITVAASLVGYLAGGLVVIETLFHYRGIGALIFAAARAKDFPMLEAGVLTVGCVYAAASVLGDVLSSALDPRLRAGRS